MDNVSLLVLSAVFLTACSCTPCPKPAERDEPPPRHYVVEVKES